MNEQSADVEAVQPDTLPVTIEADEFAEAAEPEAQESERLVPVSEARRYRKRAQAAESIAADLQQHVEEQDRALAQQREQISALRQRARINEALVAADAVDLETAHLLIEQQLEQDADTEIEDVIEELRVRKPFLFRRASNGRGAMSPHEQETVPGAAAQLERVATEAAASGRRQDLLHYLRLRRRK